MARRATLVCAATLAMLFVAAPAFACGGLIGPRGAVNLVKTTTLAAYHDGVEHYVTSFAFTGRAGARFGSLVPLPGIPSKVERGGDWTLQRLVREIAPPRRTGAALAFSAGAADESARVILEAQIDALDITVVEGGAREVAKWATDNGFVLSPDAPEVLEFYAKRSPIFMAARFNPTEVARQGVQAGDGTPIHLTIPTQHPWVPLRILALGKEKTEPVSADIFLLTDREPALLAAPEGLGEGLRREVSRPASDALLDDLRSDKGMSWVPESMWLTYLQLEAPAASVRHDLAIDPSGFGRPSPVAAGITEPWVVRAARQPVPALPSVMLLAGTLVLLLIARNRKAVA